MTARQLLSLLVPPAVFGAIVFFALAGRIADAESEVIEQFGSFTVSQLAQHLSQYVVEGDLLSLNVIVSQMAENDSVTSISVYNQANQLIAQAGRRTAGTVAFTSEMSFQDSTIGFVRLSVAPPNHSLTGVGTLLVLLFIAYGIALWRRKELLAGTRNLLQKAPGLGDIARRVLVGRDSTSAGHGWQEQDSEEEGQSLSDDQTPILSCILIVRVRPAHRMKQQFDRLYQAAQLYGGIVEQTTTEELVIHFESQDAVYEASCVGLLIREIIRRAGGNIRFGGTVTTLEGDPDKKRKAASYLASITESDLLIAQGEHLLTARADLQSFHHALVDSRELKRIVSVDDSATLETQAGQLIHQ